MRVRAGKTLTGIDAGLTRGGSISGTVTSASTSAGLPGICVLATPGNPDAFGLVRAASVGHYTIGALFPGTYRVEFSCGWTGQDNFAPQWWRAWATVARSTLVHISGAQNVRNINGALGPGAVITGTVRGGSASGPPLQGVCVSAVTSIPEGELHDRVHRRRRQLQPGGPGDRHVQGHVRP